MVDLLENNLLWRSLRDFYSVYLSGEWATCGHKERYLSVGMARREKHLVGTTKAGSRVGKNRHFPGAIEWWEQHSTPGSQPKNFSSAQAGSCPCHQGGKSYNVWNRNSSRSWDWKTRLLPPVKIALPCPSACMNTSGPVFPFVPLLPSGQPGKKYFKSLGLP